MLELLEPIQEKKVHPYYILYTRVNSKRIKYLNVEGRRGQTIKELKETHGKLLYNLK